MRNYNLPSFRLNNVRLSLSESIQLDSLRGLAAIVVVFSHANQFFIAPVNQETMKYVGLFSQLAVMVFFVLSGFLIGKSLTNNYCAHGGLKLRTYVKSRMARLYPALLFSTFLMTLLWVMAPMAFESGTRLLLPHEGYLPRSGYNLNLRDVLGSLFFLNKFWTSSPSPNGPLWSLPFELWYYVLGASIFLVRKRPIVAFLLVALAIGVTHKYTLFYYYMPVWLCGLLIAIFHKRIIEINKIWIYAATLALILMAARKASIYLETPKTSLLREYVQVAGIASAGIIIMILKNSFRFTNFFAPASSYAYTLYIIHMPIFLFFLGSFQTFITASIENAILFSFFSIFLVILLARFLAKWTESKHLAENLTSFFWVRLKLLTVKVRSHAKKTKEA